MVVSVVGTLGLPEAAARTFFDGADGPRDAHRLVATTLAGALAIALVADLTGPLWAPLLSLDFSGVLRLAVWGGAAGAVTLATQSLLRAADRVWSFLVVALVASVAAQGLAVALVLGSGSPASYMAGLAGGTAAAAVVGVLVTGSLRHGPADRRLLGRGLRLGMPLIPHSLGIYLLNSADRVAIVAILGLGAAGRYQVAYAIGSIGVALMTALNQAWLPLLLGAGPERRWEILTGTSRAVHRFAALVAAAIALLAPLALAIAAPPSYGREELVAVTAVVAFCALPYATSSTYLHLIFVTGRTGVMALAAPGAAVVNIALNVVLLPRVGLIGAAYATVAAYAFLAAIVSVVAYRRVPLPGSLRTSLVAWAAAAPAVAAGALLPSTGLGTALRCALGILVLAGAVRLALQERSSRAEAAAAAAASAAARERQGVVVADAR